MKICRWFLVVLLVGVLLVTGILRLWESEGKTEVETGAREHVAEFEKDSRHKQDENADLFEGLSRGTASDPTTSTVGVKTADTTGQEGAGALVYVDGAKYPWQIHGAGEGGREAYVADHVLVWSEEPLNQFERKGLTESGYILRRERGGVVLVAWNDPSVESFGRHHETIRRLLSTALVDKDYIVEKTESESTSEIWPDPEDRIGLGWLYEHGYDAEGVLVAVVDSGVSPEHLDLTNSIFENIAETENGRDDDGNGVADDIHGYDFVDDRPASGDPDGHGTAMAGLIAAQANNGVGIAGFAPGSTILPVRILDENGIGYVSTAVEGIEYADKMDADVINASWGGEGDPDALKAVITKYIQSGGIFVAAAGNERVDLDRYTLFPASLDIDGLIVVGGLEPHNYSSLAYGSNYSPNVVDIVAPWRWPIIELSEAGVDNEASGTSISAAIVSGIIATMSKNFPTASPDELRQRLYETAVFVGDAYDMVAFPGYPSFVKIFNDERSTVPKIVGHTVNADRPVYVGADFEIELEVDAVGEYMLIEPRDNGIEMEHKTNIISYSAFSSEEIVFRFVIYGLLGTREYGPIKVKPVETAPLLESPLPRFVEISGTQDHIFVPFQINGPPRYWENWFHDGRRLSVSLADKEKLRIDNNIHASGTYNLSWENEYGSTTHVLEALYDGKVKLTEANHVPEIRPFKDELIVEMNNHFFIFDGSNLSRLPYMSEMGYPLMSFDACGDSIFAEYKSFVLATHNGNQWVKFDVQYVSEREPIGRFRGKYWFVESANSLRWYDIESGQTELLSLEQASSEGPLPVVIIGKGKMFIASGGAVWEYDGTNISERVTNFEMSRVEGVFSGDRYLFYSSGPMGDRALYSSDGLTWTEQEVVPISGVEEYRVWLYAQNGNIYSNGTGTRYILDFPSLNWKKDSPSGLNPGKVFASDDVFVSRNGALMNGKLFEVMRNHWRQILQHGEFVYGVFDSREDRDDGLYYSRDLVFWHKLSSKTGMLVESDIAPYYVSPEGVFPVRGDGLGAKIGAGLPFTPSPLAYFGSGHLLYVWNGWNELNFETGEWEKRDFDHVLMAGNSLFAINEKGLYRSERSGWAFLFESDVPGFEDYSVNLRNLVTDYESYIYFSLEHPDTGNRILVRSQDGASWERLEYSFPSTFGSVESHRGMLKFSTLGTTYYLDPENGWREMGTDETEENQVVRLRGRTGVIKASPNNVDLFVVFEDLKLLSKEFYDIIPFAKYSGESSWYSDNTFGWFWAEGERHFIWSQEHEWLYFKDLPGNAAAFYDRELGWWYYSPDRYPNVYCYGSREWIYYLRNTIGTRWFYHYNSGDWKGW